MEHDGVPCTGNFRSNCSRRVGISRRLARMGEAARHRRGLDLRVGERLYGSIGRLAPRSPARHPAPRENAGEGEMNGAESLVRTLVGGGVDVCFANPGTSEMHFVAALDRVDGMRCVLGLFEGVATGAADGYARMVEKPAATLLHLGPGLANGLANLHNANKAGSGMVNIIGDHATY